jgi:DNA (cytosine-5)-methyltransferase 1
MYELALFAGAGGGLLASRWLLGWRTVCYVENGAYPVEVLRARIRDGLLDDAPIWDDARTFDGGPWRGCVDIISAGFPCQPFSGAGKGLAEQDDRNLWPDTIRIIREVRPEWILLENVSRLLSHAYVRRIYADLAQSGYNIPWDCIPASAVGANHQRDRLWVVAYADSDGGSEDVHKLPIATGGNRESTRPVVADANGGGFEERAEFDGQAQDGAADGGSQGEYVGGCGDEVADADGARSLQQGTDGSGAQQAIVESRRYWRGWWEVEPGLGRVVDGMAHRVDRLAAIGNGQVPGVVAVVWGLLSGE